MPFRPASVRVNRPPDPSERPLLAASQRLDPQTKLNHPTQIDLYYEHLRVGMRDLFTALGMVA